MEESQETPKLQNGSKIPLLIYGTAIRPNGKVPSIPKALAAGYRAVDTACTRKAHDEVKDGEGLKEALRNASETLNRSDILIQTKFTPPWWQAEPWPYDVGDSLHLQILKSALRSLSDLQIDFIDLYMLHDTLEDATRTLEAWKIMEEMQHRGVVRYLGICHVKLGTLKFIYEHATAKPSFVQNGLSKRNVYDRDVRTYCAAKGIIYQTWGLYSEDNEDLLRAPSIIRASDTYQLTPRQALSILFLAKAYSEGLQLSILEGTSNSSHMEHNLAALEKLNLISTKETEDFKFDLSQLSASYCS